MGTLQNQVTRLEDRLERHRLWLDEAAGGIRPDLTGATLTDLKLEGVNLGRAILRDTTFLASDLCGATFSAADLTNADLRNGTLTGADLPGAGPASPTLHFPLPAAV